MNDDREFHVAFGESMILSGRQAMLDLENSSSMIPTLCGNENRFARKIVRLSHEGAVFGDFRPRSWTVFEVADIKIDSKLFVVRAARWENADWWTEIEEKVRVAGSIVVHQPKISIRDAIIQEGDLHHWLSSAESFRIPLVWRDELPQDIDDVGSWGFEFVSRDYPPTVLRLSFCMGDQPGLGEFKKWFHDFRQHLESLLPAWPE